jgi:hypothetical protein
MVVSLDLARGLDRCDTWVVAACWSKANRVSTPVAAGARELLTELATKGKARKCGNTPGFGPTSTQELMAESS